MDPNQPWGWRQQQQAGYAPPTYNGPNPFGMQFGLPFIPSWNQAASQTSQPHPQNDGTGWGDGPDGPFSQPPPQHSFFNAPPPRPQNDGRDQGDGPFGPLYNSRSSFHANQPRNDSRDRGQGAFGKPAPENLFSQYNPPRPRNNGRSRGEGDFYRPEPQSALPLGNQQSHQDEGEDWGDAEYQPGRQRRRRRGGEERRPREHRPRRAVAPTWGFPEGQPLPFPMDNPALGPFASTRSVRQNNSTSSLPTRPIPANGLAQAPGANTTSKKSKARGINASNRSRGGPPNLTPNPTPNERDPISAPSAASGGVPDPTPAYLQRASMTTFRLQAPKPILVVIDLNGTLLHRPHKRLPSKFVERPHAKAFLERCLDQHHVVIWSSARPDNVQRMCAQLLSPQLLARVVAVWGRDRFGLSADDYNRRTQCYKRLTRLWEDPVVGTSHPRADQGGVWNQANTVLIDDSVEKARSEPHNAVTLPEFVGNVDETPQVLPLVEDYLDALAWQMDLSTYIRVRPFTTGTTQPVAAAVTQEES
ncbi:HAD-like domain-containing protein [Chaetomidium leptoderma]|uniref:Mitochondrial import inner membrane translocase subunit TIM50 n=1 Tax=Chaetomidium leptoderma TaxID=669021 RepID=A0AAN6VJX2_9PEZI|nr:HAD-like domain-containing protein [Chaetomidium leptoderma]